MIMEKAKLTKQERTIVLARATDRSLDEIGKDKNIFKKPVGREWVRQIEKKAMTKLRRQARREGIRRDGIVKKQEVQSQERKGWTTAEKIAYLVDRGIKSENAKQILDGNDSVTKSISRRFLESIIPIFLAAGLRNYIDRKLVRRAVTRCNRRGMVGLKHWIRKEKQRLSVNDLGKSKPASDTTIQEKRKFLKDNGIPEDEIVKMHSLEQMPLWLLKRSVSTIQNADYGGEIRTAAFFEDCYKTYVTSDVVEHQLPNQDHKLSVMIFPPEEPQYHGRRQKAEKAADQIKSGADEVNK